MYLSLASALYIFSNYKITEKNYRRISPVFNGSNRLSSVEFPDDDGGGAARGRRLYNPPNALEFGVWTASMGQLTSNPDGWEKFFLAIRRADAMVLFIENFKACLHSQVQQAAQEAGLVVRESLRTRTLPRRTPIKRARAPLCAVKDDTFSSHASNPYPIAIRIPTTLTLPPALHTGRVHGQHPQLPHSDRGAPLGPSRATRSPTLQN